MPARRDYADGWRESWVTLAQLPVAGLLAADYFYQQWVERSSTYFSHVSTRLALARPAAPAAVSSGDNVMADVLSEDLVDATRALVRDLVSLPGQTATYFNRHLETMIREALTRIQPDAQTDVRTYVVNELEKLNRELHRLREVAGAEGARRDLAAPPGEAASRDHRDHIEEDPLEDVLAEIRRIADTPPRSRSGQPGEREAMPSERLLLVIQAIVDTALRRFPPETPDAPAIPAAVGRGKGRNAQDDLEQATPNIARVRVVEERGTRLLLVLRSAQETLEQAERDIDDELKGAARPRARREVERTRRTRR